jgi:hypothetical protein
MAKYDSWDAALFEKFRGNVDNYCLVNPPIDPVTKCPVIRRDDVYEIVGVNRSKNIAIVKKGGIGNKLEMAMDGVNIFGWWDAGVPNVRTVELLKRES